MGEEKERRNGILAWFGSIHLPGFASDDALTGRPGSVLLLRYEIDERRDFANDGLSVREEGLLFATRLTFFTRFALVHQPDIGGLPDDALGVELIDASDRRGRHA